MDSVEKLQLGVIVAWVVIGGFCITGYVKNVIKLTRCDFKEPYKAEVIHAAGLIPPVGVVTGWLNVGK